MKSESQRITELEVGLAHLQRQYDLLNEVVTRQATELEQAHKQIAKWETTVDRIKNVIEPTVDPIDEKPPHY